MSEQNHTPEPWSYQASIPEDGFECFFINGERKRISDFDGPQDDEQFANVRRIVACVNACAGIPTDDLEQCPSGGLFHLADHANELVKQRDELLAALRPLITSRMGAEQIREGIQKAIARVKDNTK